MVTTSNKKRKAAKSSKNKNKPLNKKATLPSINKEERNIPSLRARNTVKKYYDDMSDIEYEDEQNKYSNNSDSNNEISGSVRDDIKIKSNNTDKTIVLDENNENNTASENEKKEEKEIEDEIEDEKQVKDEIEEEEEEEEEKDSSDSSFEEEDEEKEEEEEEKDSSDASFEEDEDEDYEEQSDGSVDEYEYISTRRNSRKGSQQQRRIKEIQPIIKKRKLKELKNKNNDNDNDDDDGKNQSLKTKRRNARLSRKKRKLKEFNSDNNDHSLKTTNVIAPSSPLPPLTTYPMSPPKKRKLRSQNNHIVPKVALDIIDDDGYDYDYDLQYTNERKYINDSHSKQSTVFLGSPTKLRSVEKSQQEQVSSKSMLSSTLVSSSTTILIDNINNNVNNNNKDITEFNIITEKSSMVVDDVFQSTEIKHNSEEKRQLKKRKDISNEVLGKLGKHVDDDQLDFSQHSFIPENYNPSVMNASNNDAMNDDDDDIVDENDQPDYLEYNAHVDNLQIDYHSDKEINKNAVNSDMSNIIPNNSDTLENNDNNNSTNEKPGFFKSLLGYFFG
ncbi:unnamed protein product [Cunninghamella blakesleeana]